MAKSVKKQKFAQIHSKFKVLFFDAFGVLNGATGIIPGVANFLNELNESGKPYFVVSNDSSVPLEKLAEKYDDVRFGKLIRPEQIISSGLLAQRYLEKRRKGANIVYIGGPSVEVYLQSAQNKVAIENVASDFKPDILALMSVNGYDWQSIYNKTINYIRKHPKMEIITPNPDLLYHAKGDEVGIAAGGIGKLIETVSFRPVQYFGKPEAGIFQYAMAEAKKKIPSLKKKDILMVGDNFLTDIRGANDFGLKCCMVFSGTTAEKTCAAEMKKFKSYPDFFADSVFS